MQAEHPRQVAVGIPLPRRPRHRSLDLWRGAACLLVVAYHSTMVHLSGAGSADEGAIWVPSGVVRLTGHMINGVPIFFVISGYCIAAAADSARRRPQPVRSYFTRRARRIYPPFWIIIALSIVFIGSVDLIIPNLLSSEPVPMLRPWWYSGWQWLGNFTLTETWRHHLIGGPRGHFPGHAWTLCYEEQFYAVMGLILVFASRHLFTAAALVTLATLAAGPVSLHFGLNFNGFFFDGFWLIFAAGILVYAKVNYASKAVAPLCDVVLLIALCYAWLGPTPLVIPYSQYRPGVISAFVFALAISLLHRWDDRLASSRAARPLMFCGTICYSMYLIHPPIVRSISKAFHHLGIRGDAATMLVTLPTCVAVSVAAGWAFHVAVEKHFLNARDPEGRTTHPGAAEDRRGAGQVVTAGLPEPTACLLGACPGTQPQ